MVGQFEAHSIWIEEVDRIKDLVIHDAQYFYAVPFEAVLHGEQGFRYFEEGSRFADIASTEWGQVVWQFDPQRQPK